MTVEVKCYEVPLVLLVLSQPEYREDPNIPLYRAAESSGSSLGLGGLQLERIREAAVRGLDLGRFSGEDAGELRSFLLVMGFRVERAARNEGAGSAVLDLLREAWTPKGRRVVFLPTEPHEGFFR